MEASWITQSLLQSFSLWAIRLSMACLIANYWFLIRGSGRTAREVVAIWGAGAILAAIHTVSALGAFHGWSHWDAVEATANKTEALLGIRIGAGVYVNYAFVVAWLMDAAWRLATCFSGISPSPKWWNRTIDLFLIFIAINGAIVFANGPIRWISLGCGVLLVVAYNRLRRGTKL